MDIELFATLHYKPLSNLRLEVVADNCQPQKQSTFSNNTHSKVFLFIFNYLLT